jgi:hypothetical protein
MKSFFGVIYGIGILERRTCVRKFSSFIHKKIWRFFLGVVLEVGA